MSDARRHLAEPAVPSARRPTTPAAAVAAGRGAAAVAGALADDPHDASLAGLSDGPAARHAGHCCSACCSGTACSGCLAAGSSS